MQRVAWLVLGLVVGVLGQEEEAPAEESKKKAPKESSNLAPTLRYAGVHTFLHSDKIPKVLLLLGAADADTPDWFTSAAMSYKEGKKKSVSFAVLKEDGEKTAHRFGFDRTSEIPSYGVLVVCLVDGSGGGQYARYKASLIAGGGSAVRAAKTFIKDAMNEQLEADELVPLPPFPPPDIPRKQASLALIELTYDNLPTHCFGGSRPLCVIALLKDEPSCPRAVTDLAKRHRNDPIQFAWLRAHKQPDFVSGFGLELDLLPKLVAVKVGKRSRFAVLDEPLELGPMGTFIDRIVGGDMQFKPLKPLPEIEPAYLQTSDDAEDKDEM